MCIRTAGSGASVGLLLFIPLSGLCDLRVSGSEFGLNGVYKVKSVLRIKFFSVVVILSGCGQELDVERAVVPNVGRAEIDEFVRRAIGRQVYVEGGKYLMGDFGAEYGAQRIQYDTDKNSKPLHEVELSSFSVSKFKITNEEYQFYLKVTGAPLPEADDGNVDYREFMLMRTQPALPAHVDWYEADKYCSWLEAVSGLPFSLPTEAQWEYVARSRGQFLAVATDDGTYKVTDELHKRDWSGGPQGINISTYRDREEFAQSFGWKSRGLTSLPVDRFPPNPLGLYAMSDNGFEWVSDWYDPDYYSKSPVLNPQGPIAPVYKGQDTNNKYAKVMRGVDYANAQWGGGYNVRRRYDTPDATMNSSWREKDLRVVANKTARCVVNSTEPLN